MFDHHDNEAYSAHAANYDLELSQTHIYNPETEFTSHAVLEVDAGGAETAHFGTGMAHHLNLSEGGDIGIDSGIEQYPYVIEGKAGEHQRVIWKTPEEGIAYFLHTLELHGESHTTSIENLAHNAEQTGLDMKRYAEWLDGLTESDRRLRLLDLLEHRSSESGDWAAEVYLDGGSWRSTDLSTSGKTLAKRIVRQLVNRDDHHLNFCYRNAQQATEIELHNHRVEYAEGVALPFTGGQSIRHAWLEIDGEVAEITWPWHFYDGAEAVYFGQTYPKAEVVETFKRRDGGSQMALSDDEMQQLKLELNQSPSTTPESDV